MGVNTRIGKVGAQSSAALTITWTSNEPTAANTQTIANGTIPTVAELGQAVQNLSTIQNQLVSDVAALQAQMNAGE